MKIIIKGTSEELSDLVRSQNRICSSDVPHTFGEIRSNLCACVEKFCGKADNESRPKSLKTGTHMNIESHVDLISNIVREYSEWYSESLQGNMSDQVVEKISSIMVLFADVSLAEATEIIEHVKNIVLSELPKYTKVTLHEVTP